MIVQDDATSRSHVDVFGPWCYKVHGPDTNGSHVDVCGLNSVPVAVHGVCCHLKPRHCPWAVLGHRVMLMWLACETTWSRVDVHGPGWFRIHIDVDGVCHPLGHVDILGLCCHQSGICGLCFTEVHVGICVAMETK